MISGQALSRDDAGPRRLLCVRPEIPSAEMRRVILEQAKRAGVGHIGSALSIADVVATLYASVLRAGTKGEDRDRFILSNGHTVLAVYAALFLGGLIDQSDLDTYCADGSVLGVHPQHALRGIDFSTGSLGQGLSIGAGAALAARLQRSERRTYVTLSDAELNEGSVWEAAMFAAQHRLDNLVAIVDLNGQQALGYTRDVLDLPELARRWQLFGWEALSVDGHDRAALAETLTTLAGGRPHVVIAHTTFGKGVSFMEGKIKWHYSPLSDAEFAQAIAEVRG